MMKGQQNSLLNKELCPLSLLPFHKELKTPANAIKHTNTDIKMRGEKNFHHYDIIRYRNHKRIRQCTSTNEFCSFPVQKYATSFLYASMFEHEILERILL